MRRLPPISTLLPNTTLFRSMFQSTGAVEHHSSIRHDCRSSPSSDDLAANDETHREDETYVRAASRRVFIDGALIVVHLDTEPNATSMIAELGSDSHTGRPAV